MCIRMICWCMCVLIFMIRQSLYQKASILTDITSNVKCASDFEWWLFDVTLCTRHTHIIFCLSVCSCMLRHCVLRLMRGKTQRRYNGLAWNTSLASMIISFVICNFMFICPGFFFHRDAEKRRCKNFDLTGENFCKLSIEFTLKKIKGNLKEPSYSKVRSKTSN